MKQICLPDDEDIDENVFWHLLLAFMTVDKRLFTALSDKPSFLRVCIEQIKFIINYSYQRYLIKE